MSVRLLLFMLVATALAFAPFAGFTAVRLSWNPTSNLALQSSWGHFEDSEQLEPGVDQKRWSASGTYTRPMTDGYWSTSLSWGRKTIDGGHGIRPAEAGVRCPHSSKLWRNPSNFLPGRS